MARETSRDRRERVAQMQAAQKKAERRRLFVVIAACVAVIAIIAGAVAWAIIGEQNKKDEALQSISGDIAAASCDPITDDPASGSSDHVGPGTNQASVTRIHYSTVPPSSGQHFAVPAVDKRRVYTVADAPRIETLVHNLEHGYTILWYDDTIANDKTKLNEVQAIADKFSASGDNFRDKFIAAPWTSKDESGKTFPKGEHVAFTHWSAGGTGVSDPSKQVGVFQYCSDVSGAALQSFMDKYPFSDAPEPAAM